MITNLHRIRRDIEELSKFNATPGQGLTRFSLTNEDREAREYIKSELTKLGLKVYEDPAGSIFGKRDGINNDLPVIMIGSHFDSVKNGGNFDGPAGIVMALEIMRVLEENNVKTKYPIEFVGMIEEEGGRFGGGVFGSRAMTGKVSTDQLYNNKDEAGIYMAEALRKFGFNPDEIEKAKRAPKDIKAFIELHIEQGPILETENKDIGIVDFIVGINEFKVIVRGRPDHAGTTPMDMRSDALSTASKVISKIDGYAKDASEGTVATVGILNVKPGAANIVPGEVTFTVDIRSKKGDCIRSVKNRIIKCLNEEAHSSGVEIKIIEMLDVNPVKMSDQITESLENNGKSCGFSYIKMLSGAGHDAMVMASITDVGLLFVPSKNGRSHCPEEWTDYEDLQKGIEVIYNTILDLGEEI
ncbi:M20 family metallo-hydrolase [Anaeromicrobium sediminis]|uniref:Zn-dependent hydrolase n=1 Tax=Anaeromicrobium sediminis TaxID=1478221 RepID=A0A267MJI4_9FIRM|nr:M20 family metallo-hydrolase [Anaeromicrobium sediminis]PAB59617.1 Zn-dependent hydrolase [Anaeromicrobium sediminis]